MLIKTLLEWMKAWEKEVKLRMKEGTFIRLFINLLHLSLVFSWKSQNLQLLNNKIGYNLKKKCSYFKSEYTNALHYIMKVLPLPKWGLAPEDASSFPSATIFSLSVSCTCFSACGLSISASVSSRKPSQCSLQCLRYYWMHQCLNVLSIQPKDTMYTAFFISMFKITAHQEHQSKHKDFSKDIWE